MLSVWALGHTEVRGEHSLKKGNIGGGGAWQMTKALGKSGPHILGYTCRGDPRSLLLATENNHSTADETQYNSRPLA